MEHVKAWAAVVAGIFAVLSLVCLLAAAFGPKGGAGTALIRAVACAIIAGAAWAAFAWA